MPGVAVADEELVLPPPPPAEARLLFEADDVGTSLPLLVVAAVASESLRSRLAAKRASAGAEPRDDGYDDEASEPERSRTSGCSGLICGFMGGTSAATDFGLELSWSLLQMASRSGAVLTTSRSGRRSRAICVVIGCTQRRSKKSQSKGSVSGPERSPG